MLRKGLLLAALAIVAPAGSSASACVPAAFADPAGDATTASPLHAQRAPLDIASASLSLSGGGLAVEVRVADLAPPTEPGVVAFRFLVRTGVTGDHGPSPTAAVDLLADGTFTPVRGTTGVTVLPDRTLRFTGLSPASPGVEAGFTVETGSVLLNRTASLESTPAINPRDGDTLSGVATLEC